MIETNFSQQVTTFQQTELSLSLTKTWVNMVPRLDNTGNRFHCTYSNEKKGVTVAVENELSERLNTWAGSPNSVGRHLELFLAHLSAGTYKISVVTLEGRKEKFEIEVL